MCVIDWSSLLLKCVHVFCFYLDKVKDRICETIESSQLLFFGSTDCVLCCGSLFSIIKSFSIQGVIAPPRWPSAGWQSSHSLENIIGHSLASMFPRDVFFAVKQEIFM